MPFRNKVILITGASSGIGAASAENFAKFGATLVLVGRNPKKFQHLTRRIHNIGIKKKPIIILADVTTDAKRIVCETIDKCGHLDILINNAGINRGGLVETFEMADFDLLYQTNLRSVVEITQLCVPHLIKTKGNIVNVSSIGAIQAFSGNAAYGMLKASLDHFTRGLAIELADKEVRVNSINPGVIETDIYSAMGLKLCEISSLMKFCVNIQPLKRNGKADEVAKAIAFLANKENSFVTGVSFIFDGGITLKSPYTM